ncbi:hypothetical protein F4680DRAFT_464235 [Xylaria scruposa]|nr:hypothetical protein F4680DRAFT_464235 [Xylaria scruposa]
MATKDSAKPAVPCEPERTPEQQKKGILYLRCRLQKGLLPREGSPVPDKMKQLSYFLGLLETFPDLDVNIIKATKINKVLKKILRLENIPKEEEFHFKSRSQTLLDRWNILLESHRAPTPGAESSSITANSVNETAGATTKVDGVASGVNDLDKGVGIIVPLFGEPPNAGCLLMTPSYQQTLVQRPKKQRNESEGFCIS